MISVIVPWLCYLLMPSPSKVGTLVSMDLISTGSVQIRADNCMPSSLSQMSLAYGQENSRFILA